MTKTDKKIDKMIRQSLTCSCDQAVEMIDDFSWLTHTVNYAAFPKSLRITCVFNSNTGLQAANRSGLGQRLRQLIVEQLAGIGIQLTHVDDQIRFDTEEDCSRLSDGQWHLRLA